MSHRIPGIFFFILILCLPNTLSAQCARFQYNTILPLIEQTQEARDYERTIKLLLDIRDICPGEKEKINQTSQS